mmetsp:Transcript_37962/g.80795  ORF Transcript_37962/g.80795 Transcript_37962/m.80795 type:complete len:274 (-) Transcript_37962:411-1232(-)
MFPRDDLGERLSDLPMHDAEPVADAADLAEEFSLQEPPSGAMAEHGAPSFTPLAPHEMPFQRGTLVAIDAEFVAVSHEQTRRTPRGKTIVVKPARLALARVSCVRGEGSMAGVTFLDSYIQQAEPVVDYLTRFSGLQPGDLDPALSRHHITSMKSAYIKLRQLVDGGASFVGHGLKKDFEMINIVVPAEQILDTVDLFYLPGSRRISLRFLAYHLLHTHMSSRLQDTHDSIEDARTALALYRKYEELSAQGVLETTIAQLYDIGRETGWEVLD